jgi:hypothetical protein
VRICSRQGNRLLNTFALYRFNPRNSNFCVGLELSDFA